MGTYEVRIPGITAPIRCDTPIEVVELIRAFEAFGEPQNPKQHTDREPWAQAKLAEAQVA